jgi:zinc/manganese transport system substrate-binding protein
MRKLVLGGLVGVVMAASVAQADPTTIVAAENFYGDIARQIGDSDVAIKSILNNPDQDPHLFEASPFVARAVSAARIVIYNGADFDPWMEKLLAAARSDERESIVVADLVGRKSGDNPHIWYDPQTMLALARKLAGTLAAEDPAHTSGYEQRLEQFGQSVKPIQAKLHELRQRYAGVPVTATEPIFGYVFDALGVEVKNQVFQLAVMNNTEPSASDVAAFESDLRTHRVKLLVFNSQATNPIADRMRNIASEAGVPIVGATETKPGEMNYQAWMLSELDAVDRALFKIVP